MRVMAIASVDTQLANEAIKSGTMGDMIKSFMADARPEVAYFGVDKGQRTAYFVLDMKDSSQMPVLFERFFLQLGAHIEIRPIMNIEELGKGLATMPKP